MKILIFLFLFVEIVSAGELENLFQKGNEHYLKGEYQETIRIFQSIVEKGYQGKSLYYNLGNAYFRIGKIGLAILYYEKAKKISPSDEDVNYNLAFANSKIADKIETLPKFFIFDWWENALALFSISGWTYAAYLFYLFILGAVGYYYFAGSLKGQRIAFYTGIISTFFLVLTIVLLAVNLNRELNYKFGIVVDPVVVVKFSPDQNSKDAFIVHEGLKVQAEDNVNAWIKIKLIDGKVGWLKNNYLKII
ncbi:MAG TPA: tetratricopeptide repeat protein [Ignavibacteriaceae bacterium]